MEERVNPTPQGGEGIIRMAFMKKFNPQQFLIDYYDTIDSFDEWKEVEGKIDNTGTDSQPSQRTQALNQIKRKEYFEMLDQSKVPRDQWEAEWKAYKADENTSNVPQKKADLFNKKFERNIQGRDDNWWDEQLKTLNVKETVERTMQIIQNEET